MDPHKKITGLALLILMPNKKAARRKRAGIRNRAASNWAEFMKVLILKFNTAELPIIRLLNDKL